MAAIYQWFGNQGFLDYEYILLMTTQGYMTRLVGIDYTTGDWTDFGSLYSGGEVSIASDGEFLFRHDNIDEFYQYVWRGTCFSQVAYQNDTGNTVQSLDIVKGLVNQFLVTGMAAGGDGLRIKGYDRSAPFSIVTDDEINVSANNHWTHIGDFRQNNANLPELGDCFVTVPFAVTDKLTTYKMISGAPVLQNQIVPTRAFGNGNAFGWNRDTGAFIGLGTNLSLIDVYQVDLSDLTLSFVTTCTTVNTVRAATITHDGVIVTFEENGGGTSIIRTYSRSGSTLTQLDSLVINAVDNGNAKFRISPYTRRVWLLAISATSGGRGLSIASDGTITVDVYIPYSFGTGGYAGTFISFLRSPMVVTPNGFTGIKEKLYECWQMDETGSVTRVGSMGNANLPVIQGTVTNRTGVINNAADFDGASALQVLCTDEMNTVSTFSLVLDVCIDTKAADQWIFFRGRTDWTTAAPGNEDFSLWYESATDKFVFQARVGTTIYAVKCDDLGTLTLGQFYNLYVEYNKSENKVKIRGDNGTLYSTSLPVHSDINHYSIAYFTVGRRTSTGTLQRWLDGGVDQVFWFYDALTSGEQDWMYNSGNSRAFSEL